MSQPSPTQSTEVPDEAVRILAQSLWWAEHDYGQAPGADWVDVGGERRERLYDHARFALQEAAPALRKQGADQEHQRLRKPLKAATSAMAAISAATGRARLMQGNPDLDGFTVDEELDEISAQVNALRESLAALDAAMKGDEDV